MVPGDGGGGVVQEQLAELTARFRPNIVVRGARPYAEDHWYAISVMSDGSGEEKTLRLTAYKPCNRCGVVNVHTVKQAATASTPQSNDSRSYAHFWHAQPDVGRASTGAFPHAGTVSTQSGRRHASSWHPVCPTRRGRKGVLSAHAVSPCLLSSHFCGPHRGMCCSAHCTASTRRRARHRGLRQGAARWVRFVYRGRSTC